MVQRRIDSLLSWNLLNLQSFNCYMKSVITSKSYESLGFTSCLIYVFNCFEEYICVFYYFSTHKFCGSLETVIVLTLLSWKKTLLRQKAT